VFTDQRDRTCTKVSSSNAPPAHDIVPEIMADVNRRDHSGRIQIVLTHVETVQREAISSAATPLVVAPGP
jgi:hypothetical protein